MSDSGGAGDGCWTVLGMRVVNGNDDDDDVLTFGVDISMHNVRKAEHSKHVYTPVLHSDSSTNII